MTRDEHEAGQHRPDTVPEPGRLPPTPSVSRVVGYSYPWDVSGDPAFAERLELLGISEITMAASYHATRAATPLHPLHRFVEARDSALYRPVRDEVWRDRTLRPVPATWMGADDPFADAAATLTEQGIGVNAWVVLAHSSRLGASRPDLAVRNCWGDVYSYALCVAHAEVRDYAATLAAEAVRDVDVVGVSVESCGQLGVAHHGIHEKTDGAYSPAAQRVLSVCCCGECQNLWSAAGLDPHEVVGRLQNALRTAQAVGQSAGHGADASMEGLLGTDLSSTLLEARFGAQQATRTAVLEAIRMQVPAARITLHGQADPWATGPSPAVTAAGAGEVDAILVPAWVDGEASHRAVADARALAPASVAIGAYVTVLPPADLTTIDAHVSALVAAGTDELHLYHLGLANRERLDVLGRLARLGNDSMPGHR